MLARMFGINKSEAGLYHPMFQCQEWRVLSDPIQLSQLFSRFELLERPGSRIHSKIRVGTKISLKPLDTRKIVKIQLVEPRDARPELARISYMSPVGMQLLGLQLGDEFSVADRGGEYYWRVMSINE